MNTFPLMLERIHKILDGYYPPNGEKQMKTKKEKRNRTKKSATVNQPAPVDVKAAAANDDTNQPVAPVEAAPAATAPAKKQKRNTPAKEATQPQTAAGSARSEGIRLYKLSNVGVLAKDESTTTKALFQHVYGVKRGHLMTWVERAKAVGLATAEEAARAFARMRGGNPQEFVVKAEPKPEKK
jgi:hypothetical protein